MVNLFTFYPKMVQYHMDQNQHSQASPHSLDVHASKITSLHRLSRYTHLTSTKCCMCHQSSETQDHLFFRCSYAKSIWGKLFTEWQVSVQMTGMEEFVNSLTKLKMSRRIRPLFYAMINAVISNIWLARNKKLFYSKAYPAEDMLKEIKRHT